MHICLKAMVDKSSDMWTGNKCDLAKYISLSSISVSIVAEMCPRGRGVEREREGGVYEVNNNVFFL